MGGASGRQYIIEEQLKPSDVSDIPDGDWEAAKKEVERLRNLICQVDCNMLDEIEEVEAIKSKPKQELHLESTPAAASAADSTFGDEEDCIIAPPVSATLSKQESNDVSRMMNLLSEVKSKIYEKTTNLKAAFARMDSDWSGYISREEFRETMSTLGLDITDEEFDLVNKTYPHKEGVGEADKGIGYLEFVSMLTGKLTYVPGAGEEDEGDDLFRVIMKDEKEQKPPAVPENGEAIGSSTSETTQLWGDYSEAKAKRVREKELQKMFNKRVFDTFYNMKEAFHNADTDGSGFIEKEELKAVLKDTMNIAASDEEVTLLIQEFDTNKDGKLAYNEFVKCLQV
mmetsp:Transcript_4358/g.6697  ORF Transcript_4358/g.6697 Transcript_4358/m.6697 type:complete len:341 (-) Transcript_4358:40-1062(-)